ncbi:Dabb family protein [Zavarzinella formosa]|uniref:Dabb family protein n=1 Tax=Zavarzinella formosa TaxID=360055 RepID=UPI00030F8F14|nr:Dabb family protein [Zavarzinella formosa]
MIQRMMAVLALTVAFSMTAKADEPNVGHMVFFELKEKTPEAKAKLVAACEKYLKPQPGVLYFSAGARGEEFTRDVNAKDWDVALHLVFTDKAAHDKYAKDAEHEKFIAENKDNWKSVKVYDSLLAPAKK